MNKKVLGKGLDALIPKKTTALLPKEFIYVPIDRIMPAKNQPRQEVDQKELGELAQSIKENGLIQPIIVRKAGENKYEVVAGERRYQAAKSLGLKELPTIVKEVDEKKSFIMAIIENLQRKDLNPIEEAEAYLCLIKEFGLTQEQVAVRVGKSRSSVANFLRLPNLPEEIKGSIMDGVISMGHARALLGIENTAQQRAVWRITVTKNLSVRQTEDLVKSFKAKRQKSNSQEPTSEGIYFSELSEDLSRHFGARVRIKRQGKKGKVEIEFYNDEDLNRLIELLKRQPCEL